MFLNPIWHPPKGLGPSFSLKSPKSFHPTSHVLHMPRYEHEDQNVSLSLLHILTITDVLTCLGMNPIFLLTDPLADTY